MKNILNRIMLSIIPYPAYLFIKLLARTMKFSYINFENIIKNWQDRKRCIFAFWHGRLLMMPLMYKGDGVSVLISQHKDGELISRVVKRFNINSVRGSSTRGWFSGVKRLLREARNGKDLGITPDGPRGPRYKSQIGIINIAKNTGLPIIPVAFSSSKKKS